MDALATIRPDDWNFALFLHVLGAMVMVGALVLALGYLVVAWRARSADSVRLGFRALLYGAFPGFIVMRVTAQWIYSKEGLDDLPTDPSWVGIGFSIADGGLLVLLIATIVAGVGSRRARAANGGGTAAAGTTGVRVSAVLVGVLVVAYVVALWAMTAKPV
jgi:uncharacterized membrane protein